ncbi:MAG TPA: bifunctional riboflavin kinase/FAD synthetase [Miltoncostaeaceae bacterium]|nr:bifunctional riboflavin kinase/FAD synthetase [Miltoncostaeaceae bacterium]
MRVHGSLEALPPAPEGRALAIGAFDGVHLGHRAIIGRAVERARAAGIPATVLTFEPQPIAVLRPELKTVVLTPPERKAELIAELGVDDLVIAPFTRAFSLIRWDRFAGMLAQQPIAARWVVVGQNFHFGNRGRGNAALLAERAGSLGYAVDVPPIVESPPGKPVSSTRVRRLVAHGEVAEVIPLLARPHSVDGTVVHGDQRGRALGIPTANLSLPPSVAIPARGVYAGHAHVAGEVFAAAVNVGVAPTFTEGLGDLRVEVFLLDYEDGDLYGEGLRVCFIERLRPERRFPSPEALVAQVREDIERARALAGGVGGALC